MVRVARGVCIFVFFFWCVDAFDEVVCKRFLLRIIGRTKDERRKTCYSYDERFIITRTCYWDEERDTITKNVLLLRRTFYYEERIATTKNVITLRSTHCSYEEHTTETKNALETKEALETKRDEILFLWRQLRSITIKSKNEFQILLLSRYS